MKEQRWLLICMCVAALGAIGGCVQRRPPPGPEAWNYMQAMEYGFGREKHGDYPGAIQAYRKALTRLDTVYPDLVVKAQIAVHNRIGSCYSKQGRYADALKEFRVSAKLGDSRYAPVAIEKMRRHLQAPDGGRRSAEGAAR